jgi:hypothetical protein
MKYFNEIWSGQLTNKPDFAQATPHFHIWSSSKKLTIRDVKTAREVYMLEHSDVTSMSGTVQLVQHSDVTSMS